jgi:5'-3' exonuclease
VDGVSDQPLLLTFDGNSLMHRAYHAAATGKHVDDWGRPVWAIKGLVGYIARAAAQLRPDAVLVGFDCGVSSARKVDYPGYKAHRPDKPGDLVSQLLAAPSVLREAAFQVVQPTGYEADDVLASSVALARAGGWRCVVVTSDRDSFALVDATTSVLRVRNGGLENATLVTAVSMPDVCGVEAWQYPDLAALRGDASDNLPGVRGFGSTTAARLLAAFGSVDAALKAAEDGRGDELRAAVGEAAARSFTAAETRETVDRNRRLMRMRHDLPLPSLDDVRLPLDYLVVRRALARRGIILGPSLWALTGGSPPVPEEAVPWVRPRAGARTPQSRRAPGEGQMALF